MVITNCTDASRSSRDAGSPADNEVRRANEDQQRFVDVDMALLAAHASGLPDCAGVAVGFDRLVALKLGARALADVMPFPDDRA